MAVVETPAQQPLVGDDIPGPTVLKAKEILDDPKMTHFTDFLSPEECQHLIDIAEGRWIRSTVTRGSASALLTGKQNPGQAQQSFQKSTPKTQEQVAQAPAEEAKEVASEAANVAAKGAAEPGGVDVTHLMSGEDVKKFETCAPQEVQSTRCTSRTVRLEYNESQIVERIIARVASVTGHRMDHIEQLVLVRYAPGETFMLHHDGGHRPMTVFMYLNDCEEGGETYFPNLGFKIRPSTGTAVMWSNVVDDGEGNQVADRRMDHEAVPPGDCVTYKYGMNCFVNKDLQRDCGHIKIVQRQAGA